MPLLDLIRIAEPCTVAWSSMTGDDRARHCRKCDRTVFDLSAMTRADAEALLAAKGANLCARFFERTDGTIVLADCLVRRKLRRVVAAGLVAAAALAGAAAVTSRDPEPAAVPSFALPRAIEVSAPAGNTSAEEGWVAAGEVSFDTASEQLLDDDEDE